jgi:hypothetical protein
VRVLPKGATHGGRWWQAAAVVPALTVAKKTARAGMLQPPACLWGLDWDGRVWACNGSALCNTIEGERLPLVWQCLDAPLHETARGRQVVTVIDLAPGPQGVTVACDSHGDVHVLVREGPTGLVAYHPFARGQPAAEAGAAVNVDWRWQAMPHNRFVLAGGERLRLVRVSLSQTACWAVTSAGTLLVRTNTTAANPLGDRWIRLECDRRVVSICCHHGVVTAVTSKGHTYTRSGFAPLHPFGTHWEDESTAIASGSIGTERPDMVESDMQSSAASTMRLVLRHLRRQQLRPVPRPHRP